MRFKKTRLLLSFLIIGLLITNVRAQDDYYNQISTIRYSDNLVAGMEFTWEISKYNIDINDTFASQTGSYEYTETYTAVYETTISGAVTTITETQTITYTEENSSPELPEIAAGVTITVALLKDLTNLTNNYVSVDYNYDYDDYQSYLNSFFEFSYTGATEEQMEDFIPIELLIRPNTLVFENGTEANYFEFQIEQFENYEDEYGDSEEGSIVNGVHIIKQNDTDSNNDFSNFIEFRTDVDTGVLLYIYAQTHDQFGDFEIEIKLSETKGIQIDNLVVNNDPTLSVPISAIFVYTLILIPIIVNRIRKKL